MSHQSETLLSVLSCRADGQVVLLRSGLLRHLRTYMCRLGVMRPVHRGQPPEKQQPAGPRRGRRPQPDSAAGILRAQAEAARIAHYNATSPMQKAAALQQAPGADSDDGRAASPAEDQPENGAPQQPAVQLRSTAIVPPVDDLSECPDHDAYWRSHCWMAGVSRK